MRLIILKNGNAVNIDKIKQIMVEDSNKICIDLNGGGVPVCIYNIEISSEYKEFKKKWNLADDEGFLFTVAKNLYKDINISEANIYIRKVELWTMQDFEDKFNWKD